MIEFKAEPNIWYSYSTAPKGLRTLMDDSVPELAEVQAAVKQGKHFYRARKYPDFLLLIAYDDITGQPAKCIINPVPERKPN